MEMEKNVNTTKKLGVSFKSDYSNLELHVYGDTIDELIEGLSQLRDGAFINYFVFKFKTLTEEQLLRLDDIMLTTDNVGEIVGYAERRKDKINTQKYQDKLIELKNMYKLASFTAFAIGVNIEKTEDATIKYGKPSDAEELYRIVKGVNKEKMKQFIFEKGTANDVFCFAHILHSRDSVVNMNDILEAKQIVLNSKDDTAILRWARWIGDVEEAREATNKIGNKEAIKLFNKEFPEPIIKKNFFDRFKR